MPRDISKNLRFERDDVDRLEALATRWGCNQTDVIEYALRLLSDTDLAADLGDSYQSHEQGLRAWSEQLRRACADNARTFDRAEWNLMADVNNGCSPVMTLAMGGMAGPTTLLWANVEDGHRLDGTGYKWLGEGKAADRQVAALVQKLRDLDFPHGWAVLVALQFFWEHPQEIDHQKDEWWTAAYRRRLGEGKNHVEAY